MAGKAYGDHRFEDCLTMVLDTMCHKILALLLGALPFRLWGLASRRAKTEIALLDIITVSLMSLTLNPKVYFNLGFRARIVPLV